MREQVYASLLVMVLQSAALAQTPQQSSLAISGKVLDDGGRPIAGAVVYARLDEGTIGIGKVPSAPSNANGEFTIMVNQTGNFLMTAEKRADGYPPSWIPFYYPTEDSLARVLVRKGQAAPFATVRLGKAGKIAGRIVDGETGRVVDEVQIHLCRAEVPKYCHRIGERYPDGRFNILVPEAPVTIQISASGYADWDGSDGVDRHPVPLLVASGTTKVLSVSLERLSARKDDRPNPLVLEAPQMLSPVNGVEFDHYPRKTKLEWSRVPGAVSYTVELDVCQPGRADRKECERPQLLQRRGSLPLSGIEGTSYEFFFVGAQPGRWRVWAVDAKGRVGAKSAWSKFIYKR